MIVDRGQWNLFINVKAGTELIELARASTLRIELSPPCIAGIPVLRGPDQEVVGWVDIRDFLDKHQQ